VERYRRRLSGPLRDRFDLGVDVQAVPWAELQAPTPGESTAAVRARVVGARERQERRQGALNARLEGRRLRSICRFAHRRAEDLLGRSVRKLGLSVRAVSRVLRVARTIADLEGGTLLEPRHVAEALHFRIVDPGSLGVQ
jgi:magnesium chelatase family protein